MRIKEAPKVFHRNNSKYFKHQTGSWIDVVMFSWRLEGSESDHVGDLYKVYTDQSCLTTIPIDNVVSLIDRTHVEREGRRQ